MASCARSVAAGTAVGAGGGRAPVPEDGAYYLPTIPSDVAAESEAVREEIFGPMLTVQVFDDEEEAFALAEHPAYCLAAGVHTADLGRAMRAVRRLDAGTVWVNRYGRSDGFIIPTGGFGGSGLGKDLGRQSFEVNQRHKSVPISFAS